MTGQFREEIGPLQGSCKGMRVWIVGSGPSLDDAPIRSFAEDHIFALNASILYFLDRRRYPDAWWVWWDMRAYREIWPKIEHRWKWIQAILSKRGLEVMRSHRGGGRYVNYGSNPWFSPVRTVAETAILLADFFGFEEAVLVGVDGMATRKDNVPYCARVRDWKKCNFMEVRDPGSWARSHAQFDRAMEDLIPRLRTTKVIQTSSIYPERHRFHEHASLSEVLERKRRHGKKVSVSARERL